MNADRAQTAFFTDDEEVFGWIKGSAGQRKTKVRGLAKVRFAFTFAAAAYNLVRLPKLLAA